MRIALSLFLLTLLLPGASAVNALAQSAPMLQVDVAADRHAINPNIYGIVSYGLDLNLARELRVPNVRWGGNGTSRYNWKVDASNAGFDWYFTGGSGASNPEPAASADSMVRTFQAVGAQSLITIPILPYLNKTAAWNCSFPESAYGPQQSVNPYIHPEGTNCGNSISTAGDQLQDSAILRNHVENSPTFQMGWVQHLVTTFGSASQGGVGLYQLDNEPSGWSNTHRDVQPQVASYASIAALGSSYATAIKAVDPAAQVMGPSDFTLGGWIGTPEQQQGLLAGPYYLRTMAEAAKVAHRRLLDYFDEHYYFQFSSPLEQLESTRTLWDSSYNGGTWVEQYVFNGPMQLIPRFKDWIGNYYPGTKLAFSEYSIDSGNGLITDALAEADVLGIFGREGVDFANMWNSPTATNPVASAFRLYRNVDGTGIAFGDVSVYATSSNQSQLTVYAAERSTDQALTLLILNKSNLALIPSIALKNFSAGTSATAWQYSGADLTKIVALQPVTVTQNQVTATFPPLSATLLVLERASPLPFHPCMLRSVRLRRCVLPVRAGGRG